MSGIGWIIALTGNDNTRLRYLSLDWRRVHVNLDFGGTLCTT